MDFYLDNVTDQEDGNREVREDDILHPKHKFIGFVGEVISMKVLGNYLYTGHSD